MNHLKLITSALGILLALIPAAAQESKEDSASSRLSYGVKAGATFSAFTFEYEPFTDRKAGAIAGIFAEYSLFDFLSVSAEPAYVQKGALNMNPAFLYDEAEVYYPYQITIVNKVFTHHVQVPLIFHLKLPVKACKVVPSISVGGSAAYLLNATAQNLMYYDYINNQSYYETMTEGVTEQFKPWEYHALLGPRVDFSNPTVDVFFEVNYYLGFSDVNKYRYKMQPYDFSSSSWYFTLGFRIK